MRPFVLSLLVLAGCEQSASDSDALFRLQPIDSIGSLSREAEVFGQISDAAFLRDNLVVVVDALSREVLLYDTVLDTRRMLGRRGAGPGEYQAPTRVTTEDERIAVYDDGLGRVATYSVDGEPTTEWKLPVGFIEDLEADENRIFLTTGLNGNTRVLSYDWSGHLLGDREIGPRGGVPVRPGHVCLTTGDVWFLDRAASKSYPLEPATLRLDTAGAIDFPLDDNPALFPVTMGFECSSQIIAAAVLDPNLTTLKYYVYSRPDRTFHTFAYERDNEGVVHGLGFLGDLRQRTLLTFRTKPISVLTVVEASAGGD